jgi:hypothetical protein
MPDAENTSAAAAAKLETPDVTRTQYLALAQAVVAVGTALGLNISGAASGELTAAIAAGSAAVGSILIGSDAAIRRARASNADKIAGAATTSAFLSGWRHAIPASGWYAMTGERGDQKRPLAAWALVQDKENGPLRLAGLVARGNKEFTLAEDIEGFAGYGHDGKQEVADPPRRRLSPRGNARGTRGRSES